MGLCRRTVRLLLEHNHVLDRDIDEVELILGELCANVIRHAYGADGGRYSVEVSIEGYLMCLSVSDRGRGFDSEALPEPSFTEDGGMGLFLMGQFADRIEFHAADGGGSAVVATRTLRTAQQ